MLVAGAAMGEIRVYLMNQWIPRRGAIFPPLDLIFYLIQRKSYFVRILRINVIFMCILE